VIVGAEFQFGRVGEATEFAFSLDSRGTNVASVAFDGLVDPNVWEPVLTDDGKGEDVACTVVEDLEGQVSLTGSFLRDSGRLRVQFNHAATEVDRLPRDGLMGYCRVRINGGVRPGTVTLSAREHREMLPEPTEAAAVTPRCCARTAVSPSRHASVIAMPAARSASMSSLRGYGSFSIWRDSRPANRSTGIRMAMCRSAISLPRWQTRWTRHAEEQGTSP